jgi:hypothetical protein
MFFGEKETPKGGKPITSEPTSYPFARVRMDVIGPQFPTINGHINSGNN